MKTTVSLKFSQKDNMIYYYLQFIFIALNYDNIVHTK